MFIILLQGQSALPAPVLGHMDLESVLRNAGVQILSNLPMGSSPMPATQILHPPAQNPMPASYAGGPPSQTEGGSAVGGSADISGQVLSLLGQLQAPEPQ